MNKELLLLQIRNAIANKEAEIATANREISAGDDWLCNHMEGVAYFENQIQEFIDEYNKA